MNWILRIAFTFSAASIAALILAGCASSGDLAATAEDLAAGESPLSLTDAAGDVIVDVPAELRPLRLCFISALAAEVLTDRVRLSEPDAAAEALGAIAAFETLVAGAQVEPDPVWVNADMKNAAYVFADVVARVGESRIATYIKSGLSIQSVLDGARRLAITSGTAAAMIADIRNAMAAVQAGELTEDQAWAACRGRLDANRKILTALAGGI